LRWAFWWRWRRDLLPQFDYLSTVSGGGYLGAFRTTYLNSEEKPGETPLGLCKNQLPFRRTDGEAKALRHIRHFSRYLSTGSPSAAKLRGGRRRCSR
jgi:hypothetical protein